MKLKNKKSLIAILVLFLVIGVTFAYFQSSASFENIFNTGTYKVVTTEVFESPDNWMPGEEIPKTITTKNEGTVPAAVRVSYTEKWEDKNGTDITSTIDNGTAIINLDNTNEWTKEGNYYYYNYILNPNETTSSFMKSVTLNPDLNGVTCTGEGLTRTCESTNPLYGAKYKLTLTKETVQADKYDTIWNTEVEITVKNSGSSSNEQVAETWDTYYYASFNYDDDYYVGGQEETTTFDNRWSFWVQENSTTKQVCGNFSNGIFCFEPQETNASYIESIKSQIDPDGSCNNNSEDSFSCYFYPDDDDINNIYISIWNGGAQIADAEYSDCGNYCMVTSDDGIECY